MDLRPSRHTGSHLMLYHIARYFFLKFFYKNGLSGLGPTSDISPLRTLKAGSSSILVFLMMAHTGNTRVVSYRPLTVFHFLILNNHGSELVHHKRLVPARLFPA